MNPARAESRVIAGASVALVTVTAVALLAHAGARGLDEFPLDDGWIHQVYARSLATTGTLAYNPGRSEAGFSSLLWLVTALPGRALSSLLHLPDALGAKLVSAAWSAVASALLARTARHLGASLRGALAAAAFATLSWSAAIAAVSGMEASLALACASGALYAALTQRAPLAGLCFAAACLARPECAALAPCLAWPLVRAQGTSVTRAKALAALCVPPALAAALWAAINLRITGHPLPNTFYVKATGVSLAANAPVFLRDVLWGEGVPQAVLAGPLALLGAWRSRDRGGLTVLAASALGVAAVAVSRPLFEGVTFFQLRYFLPFSLLASACAGVGVDALFEQLPSRASKTLVGAACALFLAACVGSSLHAHRTHCEEIRALHTDPARDVARFTAPDTVVAVEGAGAMRYFGGRTVVDLYGLNDADVAFARTTRERTCAIARRRPTLIVTPPWWAEKLAPAFELAPVRMYSVRESAIMRSFANGRAVAVFAARLRPGTAARCGMAP